MLCTDLGELVGINYLQNFFNELVIVKVHEREAKEAKNVPTEELDALGSAQRIDFHEHILCLASHDHHVEGVKEALRCLGNVGFLSNDFDHRIELLQFLQRRLCSV